MNESANNKIVESLTALEQTIQSARRRLSSMDSIDAKVLNRLDCYLEVVTRQRNLALQLVTAVKGKSWEEARRLAELIRQSSYLIAFDTSSLMSILSGKINSDREEDSDYN